MEKALIHHPSAEAHSIIVFYEKLDEYPHFSLDIL